MTDHAPQKNQVCLHCGADVPFGFTNCWLCRKRWDTLEPDPVRKQVLAKSAPAKPISPLQKMVGHATGASLVVLWAMLCLNATFGPQYAPFIITLAITGVFIGSWHYLSWNSSNEPTAGHVVSRFLRAVLLTFVILVALPLAMVIALLVLCAGMFSFGAFMDGRH